MVFYNRIHTLEKHPTNHSQQNKHKRLLTLSILKHIYIYIYEEIKHNIKLTNQSILQMNDQPKKWFKFAMPI